MLGGRTIVADPLPSCFVTVSQASCGQCSLDPLYSDGKYGLSRQDLDGIKP